MRVTNSQNTRRRHKEILKSVKGSRLAHSRHLKVAKETAMHAGQYAYEGRRHKKRDFRRLWIQRINGGLTQMGDQAPSYSVFVNLLAKSNVTLNRKMLAELAVNDPQAFEAVVNTVYGQ